MSDNQYAERDVIALDEGGGYYSLHVLAMTRESLDSKSEMAAELGWRDMQSDKLREALDSMLNDLNASIRRESAEREKNAKLLARIAELEGDITQIMQNSWDEYCDDTGCCPDDFRIDQGTGYLEFESGAWATLVAKRLISKLSRISG
ncbi:hypothetical protein [Lonsdalea quercina]|uniref:hypothetical protein n=1 Tax=Lonsdalea quercina TaxID=71657 RepID=UPI0039754B70